MANATDNHCRLHLTWLSVQPRWNSHSFLKTNKPKSYSIIPTNFIYLPLKMPSLYTYVHQLRVMSELAVKPQTDPSPAPITMANSHWFDDIAHIGICLGTGNRQYTICINSLLCRVNPSTYTQLQNLGTSSAKPTVRGKREGFKLMHIHHWQPPNRAIWYCHTWFV